MGTTYIATDRFDTVLGEIVAPSYWDAKSAFLDALDSDVFVRWVEHGAHVWPGVTTYYSDGVILERDCCTVYVVVHKYTRGRMWRFPDEDTARVWCESYGESWPENIGAVCVA